MSKHNKLIDSDVMKLHVLEQISKSNIVIYFNYNDGSFILIQSGNRHTKNKHNSRRAVDKFHTSSREFAAR